MRLDSAFNRSLSVALFLWALWLPVKLGHSVRVRTDTYPGKVYDGRVLFISSQAEFTPKNVQTQKERVKLVYRVKIEIANSNMELKPGMPADADILVGQGEK